MKICSLLPGATEIVAALGLADQLVGISHECDFPSTIHHAPVMVETTIHSDALTSAHVDRQVASLISSGRGLYRLNEQAFVSAAPDVVLTQDLCHVCAVTPDQLGRALQSLPTRPRLITLNPLSLGDVIHDVERIGSELGKEDVARKFAQSLRQRIAAVKVRAANLGKPPRVLCLEWLSPLYVGGHWVPEMVELAGGIDVLGTQQQPSRRVTWEEVQASQPDLVVVMPCGFSVDRTARELASLGHSDAAWSQALTAWPNTYIVDAGSYFSRPGPRLIDGVELLGDIFSGTYSTRFGDDIVRDISRRIAPAHSIE